MAVLKKESVEHGVDALARDLDVPRLRRDFPILDVKYKGRPIIYLDNAATSQTPLRVVDAIKRYYLEENSNVHRGVHYLSQLATDKYEAARAKIARFLGADIGCQLIFTRGTTEGINLVASTYGRKHIGAGDEVLITHMEHHSNIVPWQMLCEEKGAKLRVVPITDSGELIFEEFEKLLNERTKLVSVVHVSNALGTVNPIRQIADLCHAKGVPLLVDGAQSVPHIPINVRELGCDFFACSGHKMCGPTGIGVLYATGEMMNDMPPYQGGGDMILSVTFEKTTYNAPPYKFEAGTPHIEGVIALGETVDYLGEIGMDRINAYEHALLDYGTQALQEVPGLKLVGTAKEKSSVLSFTMEKAHPHDIGQILNDGGIAVRAGHHCAQPVMQRYGIPATARASLAFYNTREEIDALVAGLHRVNEVFA